MTTVPSLDLPPGVEPRAYQFAALDGARAAVRAGDRPVIVAPTGSGKTTCGAMVAFSAVRRGSPVLWIAHRRELLFQAKERLGQFGLRCGLILAGFEPDPQAPVQIAGIDTLRRRELPPARVVVLDEAHRARARTVEAVLKHYEGTGAALLAMTATPARGDGKGLAPLFTALVETVTGDDLRASGVLVPIRAYAPDVPDMRDVAVGVNGDYDDSQSAGVMVHLTGSIIDQWQKKAAGRKTLVFACTIEHSKLLRDRFLAAGIKAEHVDGTTPDDERAGIFQRLQSGETTVVSNVGVCTEGLDLPSLEAIVFARPTKSITLFLQSVGRGVRSSPGKDSCTLLDHAGNCLRLGHPEDPRVWTLEGVEQQQKKKDQKEGALCPQCTRVRKSGEATCPCGYEWPLSERREIEETDEDLAEVQRKPVATMAEKRTAYAEFVRVSKARGWKIGWARHRYREQFGVWPSRMKELEV